MAHRLTRWLPLLVIVALLVAPAATLAGEHPEHPQKDKAAAPVDKDKLADAIDAYVHKQSKDGWYTVQDPAAGKPLRLKLDAVHRERLARTAADTYFACADFIAEDGTRYDLDFFMKGKDAAHLHFTDVAIHKRAGVERYRWKEEGGVWKKVPVEAAETG
jgi:hypothetical protein